MTHCAPEIPYKLQIKIFWTKLIPIKFHHILFKNLWHLFMDDAWASTVSRLEPLQGGSLLFTSKFPEISGTHFTNIGRMKGWVDLGVTQWLWARDPWIRSPAPWPLGHCSIKVYKITVTKQLKFLYLITIYEKYCDSKKVFCDIKKLHVCLLFLLLSWKRSSFLSYKNQKNVGLFITSWQLSIMAPV